MMCSLPQISRLLTGHSTVPRRKIPASQVPCDPILSGQNHQGQQELWIPKLKDPFKSKHKMFVPTDGRENIRRPNPEELKEGLAELRASQVSEMSNPARSGEEEIPLGQYTSNSCQERTGVPRKPLQKIDKALSTVP